MMLHRLPPTRTDHLWTLGGMALVLALCVTACDFKVVTPTPPTQTQTQPTVPAALFEMMGEGDWTTCTPTGDCVFTERIQNIGSGCASGTTAAVVFAVGSGQVGPTYPMEVEGGGLAAKTIRPNEIVALVTVGYVASSVKKGGFYRIDLKWDNVICPSL